MTYLHEKQLDNAVQMEMILTYLFVNFGRSYYKVTLGGPTSKATSGPNVVYSGIRLIK